MYVLSALLGFSLLAGSYGYPSGAGGAACTESNMMPKHPGNPSADNTESPYNIEVSQDSYTNGGKLQVTVTGSDVMEGFLLMALPSSDPLGEAVGSFEVANDAEGKPINKDICDGGTTHTQGFHDTHPHYDNFTLTWNAPNTGGVAVKFYATVVRRTETFWVKVPSMKITAPPNTDADKDEDNKDDNGATGLAGVTFSLLAALVINFV